ncbi:MAG TPA: SRPBCC family protein [Blastocatellia bacterium]|nr:SRPBCC family protein [Blastocatellia bacterium]
MSGADEPNQEKWSFEHSVECQAGRDFAWQFWTNVANWAVVDSSVESATLDGPFVAGAKGITKPRGTPPIEWMITGVRDGSSARIEIPAPGAVLKCFWRFEDSASGGARITQRMSMEGEKAEDYVATLTSEMERTMPQGMQKLADAITGAAGGREK